MAPEGHLPRGAKQKMQVISTKKNLTTIKQAAGS